MLKFYGRIFSSALTQFHGMTSKILAGVAFAFTVVSYFNQELAGRLLHAQLGVSRWWSVVPVGAFVGYRVLAANYQAFSDLEQRVATQEREEELQSILGELLADGADLRVEVIESEIEFEAWFKRFQRWRYRVVDTLKEFGLAADYAIFQNADALRESYPISSGANWHEQTVAFDEILREHLRALAGILRTRPKQSFPEKELHERERF